MRILSAILLALGMGIVGFGCEAQQDGMQPGNGNGAIEEEPKEEPRKEEPRKEEPKEEEPTQEQPIQ